MLHCSPINLVQMPYIAVANSYSRNFFVWMNPPSPFLLPRCAIFPHDYHITMRIMAHNPTKPKISQLPVTALKPDVSLGLGPKKHRAPPRPRIIAFASHARVSSVEVRENRNPTPALYAITTVMNPSLTPFGRVSLSIIPLLQLPLLSH
jgi:hypothetical protein